MSTAPSIITIVDYAHYRKLDEQLCKQRGQRGDGYEIWERYDISIRAVMRRHGKMVGWDDGVDFYHSGDWFHELYNGFAVMTTTALSVPLIQDLQTVVAQHHSLAVLSFGGEVTTPMFGLDVLITPTTVVAAWYKSDAATCRRKIKEAGVAIF